MKLRFLIVLIVLFHITIPYVYPSPGKEEEQEEEQEEEVESKESIKKKKRKSQILPESKPQIPQPEQASRRTLLIEGITNSETHSDILITSSLLTEPLANTERHLIENPNILTKSTIDKNDILTQLPHDFIELLFEYLSNSDISKFARLSKNLSKSLSRFKNIKLSFNCIFQKNNLDFLINNSKNIESLLLENKTNREQCCYIIKVIEEIKKGSFPKLKSLSFFSQYLYDKNALRINFNDAIESGNLSNLTFLSIQSEYLKVFEDSIIDGLYNGKFPYLTNLTLNSSNFSENNKDLLVKALSENRLPKMISLSLLSTGIGEDFFFKLSDSIKEKKPLSITYLDLSMNCFNAAGIKAFVELINDNKLQNLKGFIIGPIDLYTEDHMLENCNLLNSIYLGKLTELKYLDFYGIYLDMKCQKILAKIISEKKLKYLIGLNLDSSNLSDEFFVCLSNSLKQKEELSLTYLNISNNHLGTQGLEALSQLIESKNLPNLKYFYFTTSDESSSLRTISCFGRALATGKCPYLLELNLLTILYTNNSVNDCDFFNHLAIAFMKGSLSNLSSLDLSGYNLKNNDDFLTKNDNLLKTHSSDSNNFISNFVKSILENKIPYLNSLKLNQCNLADNELDLILKAIESNKLSRLEYLGLYGHYQSIQFLRIMKNHIENRKMPALKTLFVILDEKNSRLEFLEIYKSIMEILKRNRQ